MKFAYADPPYPGCAHLYKDHPDYAGEVDHGALVQRLLTDFDGFVLHTAATQLDYVLSLFPGRLAELSCRVMRMDEAVCGVQAQRVRGVTR